MEEMIKHSLSAYVFNIIREDILNGRYKENDELKEMAIAKELEVSRTPVREAIRQLELEGLVYSIPNKATYVIGISSKDIQDIYEMRALLEMLCIKYVMENIDETVFKKLYEIIELGEFYAEKGNFEKVLELDTQYHELLYNTANSKLLKHTLSDFHHYIKRIRQITLSDKKRAIEANNEHREIIDAMREKDIEKSMEYAKKHIDNTMINIKNQGLWIKK